MAEAFGENVAPTDAIRDILRGYPFSIGLLREILQNSDDARASKQAFILDRRHHGIKAIYDPFLATTQGPALLAFNDALIQDRDWKALQNIHKSSKTVDTSKIGKYGIGFRSCYHVTDHPHILSGPHLVILDPHHAFAEVHGIKTGGVKLNIVENWREYSDHLTAFDALLQQSQQGKPFDGSIFRLPLRTESSDLSNKVSSPDEISDLLRNFAKEELNISLLFLRNISSIEIIEISDDGEVQIAKASIDRATPNAHRQFKTRKATIRTCLNGSEEEREWRILHAPSSEAEAEEILTKRLRWNPSRTLSQHKLSTGVDLAIPCNFTTLTSAGRLFTYLPLPLSTEFPVYINALFSLTQSRQNLRNAGEVGIVKGSDDDALIEWNHVLFDTYIPQAWAALLQVLVEQDHVADIFNAWPTSQARVHSGDNVYWKDMPLHVAKHALNLPIWPVYGSHPPTYQFISSLLIEDRSTNKSTLAALVRTDLPMARPPQYLTQIILDNHANSVSVLSPETAYHKLQRFTHQIRALDDADAQRILSYLLSTSNCRYIIGLPLVPSVSGDRLALRFSTTGSDTFHALLDETEETLFAVYDNKAVSLKRLPVDVRRLVVDEGPDILNVTKITPIKVYTYLRSSYGSQTNEPATRDEISWLDLFWVWAEDAGFVAYANRLFLVPTTQGLRRPSEPVFNPYPDYGITRVLELLGVSIIDSRLSIAAQGSLSQLQPSSDIHALLSTLSPTSIFEAQFTEERANELCDYLVKHLPSTHSNHGTLAVDGVLHSRLLALPIFPTLQPLSDGSLSTQRRSISGAVAIRGVNPNDVPILPQLDLVVYLDLRLISHGVLEYLDPNCPTPLSINEMHDLMLLNFGEQPLQIQLAFVQYIVSHIYLVPPQVLKRLSMIPFVPARDESLQSPADLIDPQAPIAALFPGTSSSLPSTSRPILNSFVTYLRALGLLATDLTANIIIDRIHFIASGRCPHPEDLARTLILLLNETHFDLTQLFASPNLSWDLNWIPTTEGLKSPLTCRDWSSHLGKTELFDQVVSMVDPDVQIGAHLREVFGWDGEVDFKVISRQLFKVLDDAEPSYTKVHAIVNELGQRNLLKNELASLRGSLRDLPWVPTRSGTLEKAQFVLLGEDEIPEIGLHTSDFESTRHSMIRRFLREMGCVERPSKETILGLLQSFHAQDPLDQRTTQGYIRLLAWLPRLTPNERSKLRIPDTNRRLCPFNSIYYNDVGPRAHLIDANSSSLAHPEISSQLAIGLGLSRLGLMDLQYQSNIDFDVTGADLIKTIRNNLQDYTDSQLLLDVLAIASNANAAEFNVVLDEQTTSANALLSPRCSEFLRVPALVIHMDSALADDGFRGILRTGIDDKGRKDNIGQYGLGPLSMFHVSELVTIISRDQVLFLNPCKAHLSLDKAVVRIPLSTVQKLYSDHLSPLNGLFGFNLPNNVYEEYSYNGTLLHLPLRSRNQYLDIEPVIKSTTSLQNLAVNFKPSASDSLLFTSITSIQVFSRKTQEPIKPKWSLSASRTTPTATEDGISAHTVTITSPGSVKTGQEWRVLSHALNKHEIPSLVLSIRDQLRFPLVIQVAVSSSPKATHNIFQTLPLTVPVGLPLHISGPFVLASDGLSIRLDEQRNIESSYNRWLASSILPKLYLSLLEDRAPSGDNGAYWPGKLSTADEDASGDEISSLVAAAVYRLAARSERPIFSSKYHPHAIPADSAQLIVRLPRGVLKVLEMIKPIDVVQPPVSVARALQQANPIVGRLSFVTPKYLHKQILDNATQFSPSKLDFEQLQELLDFLSKDPDSLMNLPLLPLEDGTFVTLGTSSKSCYYVAPPEALDANVFKPHRLVHRELKTQRLLEIEKLNVKTFTDNNMRALLEDFVPQSPTLENATQTIRRWISGFWKIFSSLGITTNATAPYPLIPTLQAGHYLSFAHCKSPSVILADFDHCREEWLAPCLSEMGVTLINTPSLPGALQASLPPSPLTVETVLKKLLNHPKGVAELFRSLDSKTRPLFTQWVRSDWKNRNKGYFQRHVDYCSIPFWPTGDGSYVPASEAQMLPRNVTLNSVYLFTSNVMVGHDFLLEKMGKHPPHFIQSILTLPTHLEEKDDKAYKTLVRVLIDHHSGDKSIPAPNSQRLIRDSSALYSSRDEFFSAAFGPGSKDLIHPLLVQFDDDLARFGLKRQRDLSFDMFKTCVEAFQNPTGPKLRERAAIIYQVFCDELPRRLTALDPDQLKTFDDLRFIPRRVSSRPLGSSDDSRYIRSLPDILTPNELVRQEFQAIAWTQRGLFDNRKQPPSRVLKVYPSLSIPTAEEVVAHLVVLATKVAQDHDNSCRNTLLDHLEQTYQWLNKHSGDAKPFLRQCTKNENALFLNVDTPPDKMENWNWKTANEIVLNDVDSGPLEHPREFMKPYGQLLEAAGAEAIYHGEVKQSQLVMSRGEEHFSSMRGTLDKMRKTGVCTDLWFMFGSTLEKPLAAHRTYLAMYSPYFLGMFSGSYDATRPTEIPVAYSRRCVECLLDYVYTGKEPEFKLDVGLALEMLELGHEWLMVDAQHAIQNIIITRKMVDPFTLNQVYNVAKKTQAMELMKHCEQFEVMNADLVRRVKEKQVARN